MLATNAQTIADLVREAPLRANVFERYKIDYCCNGGRSLEEVCAEKNLDAEQIRAELAVVPDDGSGRDFDAMSLADLADYIVERHHGYLRTNFPSIAQKAQRVVAVHGGHHGFLAELERVFHRLSDEMNQHMMKEEMVLFPLIGRMEQAEQQGQPAPEAPGGSVQNPIRMMEHEHDDSGRDLERMRELTSGYQPPDGACNTFRALYAQLEALELDLHMHIHLENHILFPKALEIEQRQAAR